MSGADESELLTWLKSSWGLVFTLLLAVAALAGFGTFMYTLGQGSAEGEGPTSTRTQSTASVTLAATPDPMTTTSVHSGTSTIESQSNEPELEASPTTTQVTTPSTIAATTTTLPKPIALLESSANFKSYSPEEVRLAGETYRDGLDSYLISCSNDNADVWTFDLGRDFSRFTAKAGVSDRTNTDARLIIRVVGDNQKLAEQEANFGEVVSFDVDISSVIRMDLEIQNTRDLCGAIGRNDDVGVWADLFVVP